MFDVARGDNGAGVIGLRHDVDDNPGSFRAALEMAAWEAEHGYSSTYYLLHGAHYWDEEMLCIVPEFEELGHEVGLHVNAVAEALRQNRDPHAILREALYQLRSAGVRVAGCVAHGDNLCHAAGFVNDEIFTECPRPDWGARDRVVSHQGVHVKLRQRTLEHYALTYDANWLTRGDYLSDSGGRWSQPWETAVVRFGKGQLHVLIHPDWWTHAFEREEVSAHGGG
jgi:hypothetical protein